jgi:hypothetical protein
MQFASAPRVIFILAKIPVDRLTTEWAVHDAMAGNHWQQRSVRARARLPLGFSYSLAAANDPGSLVSIEPFCRE